MNEENNLEAAAALYREAMAKANAARANMDAATVAYTVEVKALQVALQGLLECAGPGSTQALGNEAVGLSVGGVAEKEN